MRDRPGWILTLACVLIFAGPARSSAQVVDKGVQESQAIKAMVEESVDWYRVFSDKSTPDAMTPLRVLRWRNVTRGTQESEGVFVLWVNKGRPEAFGKHLPVGRPISPRLRVAVARRETGGARGRPRDLVARDPRSRSSRKSQRPRAGGYPGCAAQADEVPCRPLQSHDDRLEGRQIGPRRTAPAPQTALPR